jgi:ethanolamine utilization protein EutQ (cupin superfamily)
MSDNGNLGFVCTNIGALTNDFRPMFKVPSGFGGITIQSANYVTETAGTSTVQLVDLGTAGTAIESGGTLFTGGSAVAVAGVPKTMTVDDTAYIAEGHWVGAQEGNTGTTGAITIVSFSYLMGK